ncbi:MAG: hypothetical protein EOP76_11780 [Variovorax sp.]|nr:MAG: hypothetical protein EOP76_11780 [Variovorax sp.]
MLACTASAQPAPGNEALIPINDFVFPLGHGNSGKWYAEVTVEANLAKQMAGKQEFRLGVDNVLSFLAISSGKLEDDEKTNTFGLALDLDQRTFNWRDNNTRLLSGDGVPIQLNDKPYGIRVSIDQMLGKLLKYGAIRINYGQTPFKYPMPAGFSPWYYTRGNSDVATWLVPVYERIDHNDPGRLGERFWKWSNSIPAGKSPSLDRSGQYCAEAQQGSVWFLAGAAAADRIERTCTVPFGTNIVVPVVAASFSTKDPATCKELSKLSKNSPYTMHEAFLEINGVRFDRLQGYAASFSDCEDSVVEANATAQNSIWLGMWVPLRPLPRGEHKITFGGLIKAMNMQRQVTYKVTVK